MEESDSKNRSKNSLVAALMACALVGCSQTTVSGYVPDLALSAPITHGDTASDHSEVASLFQELCLRPTLKPAEAKEVALRLGWKETSDGDLEKAGLSRLRKTILEIPGGGARFREEQEIVARFVGQRLEPSDEAPLAVAAFERRIAGSETRSVSCTVYVQADFLKTCEALGRLVDRAPDRNQRYPHRDAHFIQWSIQLDGREAILSCSRTPQSALLPYDGTTLSVSADHSGTARKTAFKHIHQTKPVFTGSDR